MLRSIAASSSWQSSVIAMEQELNRLPFEWKNKSFLWLSFQCVEWKATSVTAAEFYGAVIPSDLHVLVNSAVVHPLAYFCEPRLSQISLNIPLSDSVLETKKLRAKVLNSTCRIILVCKILQNMNFDGLTFLTALVLYSQSDYLKHSNRDSDWLIVACFMRV